MVVFLLPLQVLKVCACRPVVFTNMRRSPYTSEFSAVLLSCLLAIAFGSVSQPARNLQYLVQGIPPAAAEKEAHETGGDLLSHGRSSGAASTNAEHVDAGDRVPLNSNALQFGPPADVIFPHQIRLPRYFSGHLDKQKDAAGREAEPKHVVRAGSRAKPPESGRRKRSANSTMKDHKGDNGDHPLPDEPGAKVHCWSEANVFDVVLPAAEVAKHFPHECQHPLSCNTTCVAKVLGREVCAGLKSGCTAPTVHAVPETQIGTAQDENKQLASFEKNVERRLSELDAKLAQLSLQSGHQKDKLVELGDNLKHLSDAREEQLSAALEKTLDSQDRKAAEVKSLFNEKSEAMMNAISSVLSMVQSDSKTHLWTLKGYAALKSNAIKTGWAWIRCQKVYIGRYLVSWGIQFDKSTDGVTLHLTFQLHKGISDEFLDWPFSNKLKLSIIHPESGEKQEGRHEPDTSLANYARPVETSNKGVYFSYIKFESSYLENNGYVKNDQLLLKLEMLS